MVAHAEARLAEAEGEAALEKNKTKPSAAVPQRLEQMPSTRLELLRVAVLVTKSACIFGSMFLLPPLMSLSCFRAPVTAYSRTSMYWSCFCPSTRHAKSASKLTSMYRPRSTTKQLLHGTWLASSLLSPLLVTFQV
jgi:hypothetical protein